MCQCYERDVQANTSNYEKSLTLENYDRYWWWMVYGKSAKLIPPLRITKLSKKAQENKDEIQKKYTKLISGGMIGNYNYIRIGLNRWIQNISIKGINPIQFLQKVLLK